MSMTKYRIDRRKALGCMGGAVSLVAVPGARVSAQTLDKVSYQTNWRAQAEHGGFYLARRQRHLQEARHRMRHPPWAGRSRIPRSSCSAGAST